MITNSTKRLVSLNTFANNISRSPYFKLGYESVIKNIAYDYSIESMRNAIHYERGRAFAIWCKQNKSPRAVWRGAVPANTLIERVANAALGELFV